MAHTPSHPAFSVPHKHGEDYASWLIQQKADELVGHFGITEDDREDIEQELALDLIRRWPKFDPQRSKPRTFIARVIRNKVSTLIRHRMSEQQQFEQVGYSIDATVEEEVTTCFRTGQPHRTDQEYVALREDVRAVLARLPPELREVCERLKRASIPRVAKELGIPVTTLRYRLKKLRDVFEEAGLRDYL